MKVKYLAVFDGNLSSGVTRKLMAQTRALKSTGINADLVLLGKDLPADIAHQAELFPLTAPPYRNSMEKIWFLKDAAEAVEKYCSECDIVYFRGLLPSPFLVKTLVKARRAKVVFEIQSIEELEARLNRSLGRYWMTRFFAGSVLRHCDGIVGVTDEITSYYRTLSGKPGLFCATVGNGISVGDVPMRKAPAFTGRKLDLLCVGKIAEWHGIDRLVRGMAADGEIDARLNIVGEGKGLQALQVMTRKFGLEEKVIFHGFKTGGQLDDLFDRCHVGIGSLGIHRKGIYETSELKAREYCARGIPFINSAEDRDFPAEFRYRLQVPANEDQIEMGIVKTFAETALRDMDHPSVMRDLALRNLDWTVRMKELAGFFQILLSSDNGK